MANSLFNIVVDNASDQLPDMSLDMAVEVENEFICDSKNMNAARSSKTTASLLHLASQNGGSNFNIFLSSLESKALPHHDPRLIQQELKLKIPHASDIGNVSFTRAGSIIISTKSVECAIDVCSISDFLGVAVSHRVVWENITNRFLLFNIPVDIPLADLGSEITNENNINILELRRFIRKDSGREVSPVLITSLGTSLPQELKLWYSVHKIRQFIDRPRQCLKCFKFNHVTAKCKVSQLCVTCGSNHDGLCSSQVRCSNCAGNHRADFNQCPARIQENEFLNFKCKNFLSFIDARRKFFRKSEAESYAKATIAKTTNLEDIQKMLEIRTNHMLKILIDVLTQQAGKVMDSLASLNNSISNLMDYIKTDPLERRKRPNKGDGTLK